jgi:hypothetical protein
MTLWLYRVHFARVRLISQRPSYSEKDRRPGEISDQGGWLSPMNSLDLFTVRALMQALQQIHSTLDLETLPETLFSAVHSSVRTFYPGGQTHRKFAL